MDKNAMDIDGQRLPTLVYMAQGKRPQCPYNFKAGAMNALVSFKLPYVGIVCSRAFFGCPATCGP